MPSRSKRSNVPDQPRSNSTLTRSKSRKLPVQLRPNPTPILLLPLVCILNTISFLMEHRKFHKRAKNYKQIFLLLFTCKSWNQARLQFLEMCSFRHSRELEIGQCATYFPSAVLWTLNACTSLQYLDFQFDFHASIVTRILAFDFPVLKVLRVHKLRSLASIAHLTSLTKLDCSQCSFSNLHPICTLTNLVFLEVHQARCLTDITAVANFNQLEALLLPWCTSLTDITPCFGLTKLCVLDVSCCMKLRSPQFLTAIVNLQELRFHANPFSETEEYKRVMKERPNLRHPGFSNKGYIDSTYPY